MRVRRLALSLLLATASFARADDIDSWGQAYASEVWSTVRGDLHEPGSGAIAWTVQVVANDGWSTTAELVVSRPWKSAPTLKYARTLERNLVAQLDGLREASPRITVAQAAARLKARRGALDDANCPAAVAIAERLPAITLAALPENVLTLDAPFYEVTLAASHRVGRTLNVRKGEDDLARWCEEILAAAVACEGAPPRQ